jgi:hypothetical protein
MNDEPAPGRFSPLTPETLTELEKLVRQRLGGRLREFRLSIRDAGLVLGGLARSHHAKQLAQHALADMTGAPIRANEIKVCVSPCHSASDTGVAVAATPVSRMPQGSPPGDLAL